MFKTMRAYRDEYGTSRQRYIRNTVFKRLESAKRLADANKGGFVIRVGELAPIYVGEWQ